MNTRPKRRFRKINAAPKDLFRTARKSANLNDTRNLSKAQSEALRDMFQRRAISAADGA